MMSLTEQTGESDWFSQGKMVVLASRSASDCRWSVPDRPHVFVRSYRYIATIL